MPGILSWPWTGHDIRLVQGNSHYKDNLHCKCLDIVLCSGAVLKYTHLVIN